MIFNEVCIRRNLEIINLIFKSSNNYKHNIEIWVFRKWHLFWKLQRKRKSGLSNIKRQIIVKKKKKKKIKKKKIVATNYCDGLVGASFFGSKYIVDLMISLGSGYFDFALSAAALGSKFEIAKEMISKWFLFKKKSKKV